MQHRTELQPSESIVLLAEDDDDTRLLIATFLRRDGYDVIDVDDGAALDFFITAMYALEHQRPRLILSDIHMGGMSGLDVAAHVRRHDARVPIVLFSAYVDARARREAALLGVDTLLPKPFLLEDLRRVVLRVAPPSEDDFVLALLDDEDDLPLN